MKYNLFEEILEAVYPTTCIMCEKIEKTGICKKCLKEIEKYSKYKNYKIKNKYFDNHIYFFSYEGLIRNKIIDFKFNEKVYYSKGFAKIILNNEKMYGLLKKYDIIVPVPIHKNRKKERGYNQSAEISRIISKEITSLKLEDKVLIKSKNIVAQSTLNAKQRKTNIKDAFKIINEQKIKDKKIILFDDIYTTGSTVNECSKLLKMYGANKITVITIAKD